jgi:hypothetical protein
VEPLVLVAQAVVVLAQSETHLRQALLQILAAAVEVAELLAVADHNLATVVLAL